MKALVVLYYWPPSGGPGVQRGLKTCRFLRDHGIEPVVVTVPPATYELPGEYPLDRSLLADAPDGVRVVHTRPPRGAGLRAALVRARLFRPASALFPAPFFERQAGWLGPLTDALLRAIRDERPDVLLTSSQPYVVHLAGRAARVATGIPWVADFRDPWTQSWGRVWPSRRAFDWEERREESVLADADAVVANTPGCRRDLLARRPWLDPRRVTVIPNGYDPDDFGSPRERAAPHDASEFRIVHSGAFRARAPGPPEGALRAWIAGRSPVPVPYDLSTHAPEPLFRAVARLGGTAAGRRIRVRLVGEVAPGWLRRAEELGISDCVESLGYRPHRDAVAEVLAADLLYLPTITRRDGGAVANVPAKTYEYLGSGRPLAALAGPGDVRDLLAGRDRCVLLPPDGEGLAELVERSAAGRGPPAVAPDPDDARPWRRSATAERTAALLNAVGGKTARGSAGFLRSDA